MSSKSNSLPLPEPSAAATCRRWALRAWHFLTINNEVSFVHATASPLTVEGATEGVTDDWLRSLMFQLRPAYRQVILMALVINLLAVLTALFTLQVYDRVVAHAGYASLVALVLGMVLVIGVDYVLRGGRA